MTRRWARPDLSKAYEYEGAVILRLAQIAGAHGYPEKQGGNNNDTINGCFLAKELLNEKYAMFRRLRKTEPRKKPRKLSLDAAVKARHRAKSRASGQRD